MSACLKLDQERAAGYTAVPNELYRRLEERELGASAHSTIIGSAARSWGAPSPRAPSGRVASKGPGRLEIRQSMSESLQQSCWQSLQQQAEDAPGVAGEAPTSGSMMAKRSKKSKPRRQ